MTFADLIKRGHMDARGVKTLVLDEADEMLNQGDDDDENDVSPLPLCHHHND